MPVHVLLEARSQYSNQTFAIPGVHEICGLLAIGPNQRKSLYCPIRIGDPSGDPGKQPGWPGHASIPLAKSGDRPGSHVGAVAALKAIELSLINGSAG